MLTARYLLTPTQPGSSPESRKVPMKALEKSFFDLTAADVMTAPVAVLQLQTRLRDVAQKLDAAGIHGAPVVDGDGRCVGVFSTSDLARWAANRDAPPSSLPCTCQYQEMIREVGGEVVLCLQPPGACSLQQSHQRADGSTANACEEPHCVPVDWQVVHIEVLPQEDVRHYMTTGAVTAVETELLASLAKRMIEHSVHRIIIVDREKRPAGIVSSSDLMAALARYNSFAEEDI